MNNKQKITLIISSLCGIVIGIIYLPFVPFYILGLLSEAVISAWAIIMIVISVLTLISALVKTKYQLTFIKSLLFCSLLLNISALFLYWQFGIGNIIGENSLSDTNVTSTGFVGHLVVIILLFWSIIQIYNVKTTK